ncbi:Por secretion system C-terminal sorting domain-containing protein [Chryseolinea serpens]|uniref:Por secretion system C-terminal sorting domain-containing protein n=1 Tax=Chryseolinea serpens TaxID=947013 RepID=A0A1M5TJX2_9BACT|nr:T9SS type A sorting domain-containing protein [Chryseolinea serpens]SHH50978.1 Por secretion system C-terminal sorting domain-containing protein [Chryseolinea serpens]
MIAATPTSRRLVTFLAALFFTFRLLAQSGEHLQENWITDSDVNRIEHSNGYTMLSGYFSQAGPYQGGGVTTDPTTGVVDTAMPKIHGSVQEVISDGSGGWYVAGYFEGIDTVRIQNLAHIKSDKTVDRTWKPNPDGGVTVLALDGSTLYAGGNFTLIAGQSRKNLVSFNATTGALTAWNPAPDNEIYTIAVAGTTVYVGGYFGKIGSATRYGVAAIDATTGIPTSWAPVLAGSSTPYVNVIKLDANNIYIGGYFTTVGGVARGSLAQFTLAGALTAWDAKLTATPYQVYVNDIEVTTNVVFVAGYFTAVNGTPRTTLVALDRGKASLLAWDPAMTGSSVSKLSSLGNMLYLAGYFDYVGAIQRYGVASIDISDLNTVTVTNWAPRPNTTYGSVVTPVGSTVFVGGYMNGFNWLDRPGFVLMSEATHEAWPFPVDLSGGGNINTIAVKGNVLYIGGRFNLIGRDTRNNLAAFDLTTGALLPWDPSVDGLSVGDPNAEVYNIRIKDNLLYVAGRFRSVNNANTIRFGLAAVELTTGAANAWNPSVGDGKTIDQMVLSIDIVGNTVYASGSFSLVGGSNARGNLAAIDATSGAVLPWAPISNGPVRKIRVAPNAAYVVGDFANGIGGQVRTAGIAALDLSAGKTLPWDTLFGGSVSDIALSATDLYVSGYFDYVGKSFTFRPGLCSFSLATGALNPWLPDNGDGGEGGYEVEALSISPTKLYVGGYINYFGIENRENYGEYGICPAAPVINSSADGTSLTTPTPLAGSTIQWYRNNVAVSGATTATLPINMFENATYAVEVTYFGCVGRSTDYTYLITGTEKPSNILALYPNPVRDELNIHLKEAAASVTFTINDITGRPMKVVQGSGQEHVLSLRDLPAGPYVLMIDNGAQKQAHKIIKVN